jgi:hypothetical protein
MTSGDLLAISRYSQKYIGITNCILLQYWLVSKYIIFTNDESSDSSQLSGRDGTYCEDGIGVPPRKSDSPYYGMSDYSNWYPSPSKSDSTGCGTVTNQELVQPHMLDFALPRDQRCYAFALWVAAYGGWGVRKLEILSEE